MENPVLIFGAKGIALTVLEIFESNKVLVYGFLEDDTSFHGKEIQDWQVFGPTDDVGFLNIIGKKADAFVAIENNKVRKNITQMLIETCKAMPVNAIHERAYISKIASLGHGNMVAAGAYLGAKVQVGSHCIIHGNVVLDSNVKVEDYVQIGAGTVINPEVTVEEGAFVGSGVTVISGVTIGKNARVGAGSVVMSSVKAGQTVFGVPAVEVKS
ncbi:MAG: NeuD/PglB/VioB family sugar acetyltransferase [Bacteroidota bacterium]|nr:NeuD/PglB/VioB family sugar acetyltransferase [Bacteroidota bacterium]